MKYSDVFDEKPKTLEPPLQMARRLKKIVREILNHPAKYSDAAWANDFRLLINDLKGDAKQVWAILDWYEEHAKSDSPFKIQSAKGFRKHFDLLSGKASKSVHQINVTDEEMGLALAVSKRYAWPYAAVPNIPHAVHECMKVWPHVRAKLREMNDDSTTPSNIRPFVMQLRNRFWCVGSKCELEFCLLWFGMIYEEIKGWKEWSGDFSRYLFKKDGEFFEKKVSGWAHQYGDVRVWHYIKSKIWEEA
jgi:hypothetical protein